MTTPMSNQRILVVAGTLQQANTWAQSVPQVTDPDWIFVHSTTVMHGRRRAPYVLIGTYLTRKDWPAIRAHLAALEAVPFEA